MHNTKLLKIFSVFFMIIGAAQLIYGIITVKELYPAFLNPNIDYASAFIQDPGVRSVINRREVLICICIIVAVFVIVSYLNFEKGRLGLKAAKFNECFSRANRIGILSLICNLIVLFFTGMTLNIYGVVNFLIFIASIIYLCCLNNVWADYGRIKALEAEKRRKYAHYDDYENTEVPS